MNGKIFKQDVLAAFFNRTYLQVNGIAGVVQKIEHEDGSGDSWNVYLIAGGQTRPVYIRFDKNGKQK